MLTYITVKEAFKNADSMNRKFKKQKSTQTMITRKRQQLKSSPYMDRLNQSQIRAWNMMTQQQKLAKQFPKASIWKAIFNDELRVYS